MKINKAPIIAYVKKCIKNGTPETSSSVCRRFGHHHDTIRKILEEAGILAAFRSIPRPVMETIKEHDKQAALRKIRQEYKLAVERVRELEAEVRLHRTIEQIGGVLEPHEIQIRQPKGRKEATAVVMSSDWHIEEEVRPETIGGVNAFNKSIAKTRIDRFFERSLKLLNMCRKESYIKRMVVASLGDFITSWIHEDLISETTPPEALLLVYESWVSGIDFWLQNADLDEIIFVGVCGNHGRITKRRQFKKSAEKNYEWLIYNFLCKWYSRYQGKTKITFSLPAGYFNWIDIYGRKVRVHHGDGIRYYGGVGGLHIPLRKAIAQWNKARHADLDVLGHWHTRKIENNYVVNGSVIGYNEFAESIKGDYEAPLQCFFIMHPKYDKTAEFSIRLD